MYKNDIGLSFEVCNFNKYSEWVLAPYLSDTGLLHIIDDHHLVLRTRIHEAILNAVVAEREACSKVAEKFQNESTDALSAATCSMIALGILIRNITEAKEQDTHASEDEKV